MTPLTPETTNVPVPVLNDIYTHSNIYPEYQVCRECSRWVGTPHEETCKLGWLEWAAKQMEADRAALAEARNVARYAEIYLAATSGLNDYLHPRIVEARRNLSDAMDAVRPTVAALAASGEEKP